MFTYFSLVSTCTSWDSPTKFSSLHYNSQELDSKEPLTPTQWLAQMQTWFSCHSPFPRDAKRAIFWQPRRCHVQTLIKAL